MPPFIPQKRRLSTPTPPTGASKPTLFQTADKPDTSATLQQNRSFLEALNNSEDESSPSQISSDEFEDALPPHQSKKLKSTFEGEEDEDQVWESAIEPTATQVKRTFAPSGSDIELTLDQNTRNSSANLQSKKKGPSKIERQIRVHTHCMHVQSLLFHNAVRNGWACDAKVQSILVKQLPSGVKNEIERWKVASGISPGVSNRKEATPQPKADRKGKRAAQEERNQRDWGKPAQPLEKGVPNMSSGNPLISLLKLLAAYWKKRFTITAPGLRKHGYASMSTLEKEILSFKSGEHDEKKHGERIHGIEAFRKTAIKCEGSRDVGAQLFTALIRGLGLDARLVGSLQCVGFGWNKNEEAREDEVQKSPRKRTQDDNDTASSSDGASSVIIAGSEPRASAKTRTGSGQRSDGIGASNGAKSASVEATGVRSKGSVPSVTDDDDESVVDITPSIPRHKPNMNFDRDLLYPIYWTEVISPITDVVYPVESLVVNHAVATNAEHIAQFEPRGAKAEKAKQVFAYVVAHSGDGSAKDVTVRYLKRQTWPGRTKAVRMPTEKLPVYNETGKIKYHEEYDWFKAVMSGYVRTSAMRTAVDEIEEASDLKIVKPEKMEKKISEETLQGYKNSAEYVLERHLRREEALIPGAKPVKTFTAGKGDKLKEEEVYRRKDVEVCRTSESWHKEGRAVKGGEQPLKMVPVRAVTLTRKREVEEAERDGGGKLKQGLYAWDQTDWIIPPPIQNGVIPKNAYGNMDCYVPTMIPKGAAHIPLRSTMKICKRLGIDYAEAVTGFEFGNKRAVPIVTGVVVAEENEHAVIDAWEKDEEERRIKEDGKREKMSLAMWRKWLMGLRIVQRVREEYGEADELMEEELNPFTNQRKAGRQTNSDRGSSHPAINEGEDAGGGFFPDDPEDISQELRIEDELRSSMEISKNNLLNPEHKHESHNGNDCLTGNKTDSHKADHKGSTSKRQKPKPMRGRSPLNKPTSAKAKKRKASPVAVGSGDPGVDTVEGHSTDNASQSTARVLPKRKAARKSASALKSHYFDHSSDDNELEQDNSGGKVTKK